MEGGGGKLNDRGFKDTSCSRVYSEEVAPQRFCEMPNKKTFLGCVGRSCAQIYHRLGVQETGSRWHPAAHFLRQIDHCRPNSAGSAENSLLCKKSSFFKKRICVVLRKTHFFALSLSTTSRSRSMDDHFAQKDITP